MAVGAPGILDLLCRMQKEQLLNLKSKSLSLGQPAGHLLQVGVLLALGQDTEARIALEALREDRTALAVATAWVNGKDIPAPEDEVDVQLAMASIYRLLAEEHLCRKAGQDSFQAWNTVRGKAQFAYDPSFNPEEPGGFVPLKSDVGGSQVLLLRERSSPRSIPGCRPGRTPDASPRTLRSLGTPASFSGSLEISQSPTVPFFSTPPQRAPPRQPSKLCDGPMASSNRVPEDGALLEPETNWPPEGPLPAKPSLPGPRCPAVERRQPAPSTRAAGDLELPEEDLPAPSRDPLASTPGPVGSSPLSPPASLPPSSPSAPDPSPLLPPSPSGPLPSVDPRPSSLPGDGERRFFSFVVLHAPGDEAVALRVQAKLERLGVPDGATFCEDFLQPGKLELSCLQEAIDHSAFTVLLLTDNYNCRQSLFQVHTALHHSICRRDKRDSVVPFLPRESQRRGSEVQALLSGLVPLDERSPVFQRKVTRTFTAQRLREQREIWSQEQAIRVLQERSFRLEEERRREAQRREAKAGYLRQCLLREQVAGMSLEPQSNPGLAASATPATPPGHPPSQTLVPQQLGAPQPLIIHNAQMVQLGLHNYMWGRGGPREEGPQGGLAEEWGEGDESAECPTRPSRDLV
ncbi:TIR domain-containing adapter molecule 1 [Tachyglossus aculeatus]|uniref:TIR domain-containing adapter molecule 1 n=1 Tax=Tachyglossus aculeatus TaxID=9261 RepID=UPI0018F31C3A|nr:TIR domain-containing adapter molecule 1 [Tachyglossus aculeatus]